MPPEGAPPCLGHLQKTDLLRRRSTAYAILTRCGPAMLKQASCAAASARLTQSCRPPTRGLMWSTPFLPFIAIPAPARPHLIPGTAVVPHVGGSVIYAISEDSHSRVEQRVRSKVDLRPEQRPKIFEILKVHIKLFRLLLWPWKLFWVANYA
jgi:hypothetical protein